MKSDGTTGLGPMGAAALAYAAEGFYVFRVAPGAKHPAEPNGHLNATNDPDEIRLRWTETPHANVGIAAAPSGLTIVDIDDDPETTYPAVIEKLGPLPPTRIHMTAGGGAHLLYRVADGATGLGRKIRPWGPELPVDVLGDGYVIAPPSTVNGKPYVVRSDAPIVFATDALVEIVKRRERVAEPRPRSAGSGGVRYPAGMANGLILQDACDLGRTLCDLPDYAERHEALVIDMAVNGCEVAPDVEKVRGIADRARALVDRDGVPERFTTHGLPKLKGNVAPPPATGVRVVSTVAASSVKIETTRFVDPHKTIPVGALTVLAGDPGTGKTTFAMRLAARVSSSAANYRGGAVIVVSAEDSPSTTLVPRGRAERGNLDRIHFLIAETDGAPDGLRLPDDVDELRRVIVETGAVLVIVDPLNAHLGAEINGHRDQDIRRALAPLHRLCEELHVSIVLLMHLNKSVGGSAIYRVGGSIGSMGAARSGILMTAHPESDDEDEDTSALRVLSHVKCNVGPKGPGQIYRVEPVTLDADGHTVETSRLAYVGVSDIDTDTLLDPPKPKRTSAKDEAAQFLRDYLADREAHASADVKQAARDAGLSVRTVERVAKDVVNADEQATDEGRHTVWTLRPFGRQGVAPKGVPPTDADQVGATPASPQTQGETAIAEGVPPTDPLLGAVGATPLANPFLLSSNGASRVN